MDGWEQQESGWWTHVDLGGVTLESDHKWWLWRKGRDAQAPGEGPFKTMREAMNAANPCAWCEGVRGPDEKCACTEES